MISTTMTLRGLAKLAAAGSGFYELFNANWMFTSLWVIGSLMQKNIIKTVDIKGHPVRQAKSGAPAEAGPPLSVSGQARPTLEREPAWNFSAPSDVTSVSPNW